jgi:hypothetical protein
VSHFSLAHTAAAAAAVVGQGLNDLPYLGKMCNSLQLDSNLRKPEQVHPVARHNFCLLLVWYYHPFAQNQAQDMH